VGGSTALIGDGQAFFGRSPFFREGATKANFDLFVFVAVAGGARGASRLT
jgi:hypothetical protein